MKIRTKSIAIVGIVAAVYAAVTISQAAIGFGPIQFRVAEALNLLAFFNPIFVPGIVLGVFTANIFSPYGVLDMVFGTAATYIALMLILQTKRLTNSLFLASLWPTIINAIIIPMVFLTYGGVAITMASFLPFAASVALGQFTVVTVFGYTFCRILIAKNPRFIEILKAV